MKPSSELAPRDPELTTLAKTSDSPPHSYNYGVDPNARYELHLIDYWRAVRKRIWMVIGLVALITMLAVVYVARKPDYFEAQARVEVKQEDNSTLTSKMPYFYSASDDSVYFNTQLQILVSPGLMRRVVRTLDLDHNPDFFKGAQRQSSWQTLLRMVGLASKPQETAKPVDQLPLT